MPFDLPTPLPHPIDIEQVVTSLLRAGETVRLLPFGNLEVNGQVQTPAQALVYAWELRDAGGCAPALNTALAGSPKAHRPKRRPHVWAADRR